jgi:hypothetical protein
MRFQIANPSISSLEQLIGSACCLELIREWPEWKNAISLFLVPVTGRATTLQK